VPAPVVKAPAPVVPPPVSEPEPEPAGNWFDPLLANPVYWGGALAALGLGGVLWWVMASGGRRRKTRAALDDSIMSGGDVSPTVMTGGASGGSVNTGDTSFLTDFSQAGLGTIDTHDVDPIAEAEVYMAYGRDAQAEEILKEAVGKNPDRPEIRVKLLEIYAARRNTSAYEAVAGELYAALDGKPSPLWDKACEMGRGIDPTNPLYGGVQSSAPVAATVAATAAVAGGALAFDTAPKPGEAAFGLADAAPEHTPYAAPQFAESVAEAAGTVADPVTAGAPLEFESAGHVLNFDGQSEPVPAFDAGVSEPAPAPQPESSDLDFDLADLDLPAAPESAAELDLDLDLGMGLENDSGPDSKFDFSGLDLDLGDAGGNDLDLDEAGTKLDLARAYVEMGDKEGAREILNEVLAEGSERQKSDAKALLGSLG
jgi:pilus assembly protein FimV